MLSDFNFEKLSTRVLIVTILLCATMPASRAFADTYIHAPTPPYCSPRGGEPNCIESHIRELYGLDSAKRGESVTKFEEKSLELDHPTYGPCVQIQSAEPRRLWFLGEAHLVIFRYEKGSTATVKIATKRQLTERRAQRAVKKYSRELAEAPVRELLVIRAESSNHADDEWELCTLRREDSESSWEAACGVGVETLKTLE